MEEARSLRERTNAHLHQGVADRAFDHTSILFFLTGIAIGDQTRGIDPVPDNAQDELKRHADYISPFAEIEGVIDIIRHLNAMTA